MKKQRLSRRQFHRRLLLAAAGLGGSAFRSYTGRQDWRAEIRRAGNLESEARRYALLSDLAEREGVPSHVRAQLAALLPVVDYWAHGREKYLAAAPGSRSARYLSSFFSGRVSPDTYLLPLADADPALRPLLAWYRARMLIHELIEHGAIQKVPARRRRYLSHSRQLLEESRKAFPENRLIGMYLGEAIPWEKAFDEAPTAPAWAVAQREVLERLADILHWWVAERQVPDGQFGGGWGDDVEMWRRWLPVLIGFEDPELVAAQERLSTGLFHANHMHAGYTDHLYDVEHTAEDSADTITPMLHLRPADPVWQRRAWRLLELAQTRWMGRNERGQLQFKSTYFNAKAVDPDPRKACDTVYHPRALQPVLLLWQRTGDARLGHLVLDWMDTWVDATARAENGKPAGIIPSAIHWPDGAVGGTTGSWWIPGNHDDDPLYVWPSAMRMLLNTLLLCYHQSGRRRYLAPLFSMASIFRRYGATDKEAAPGSAAWCARRMPSFLLPALVKYRQLSGDTQFDDLIRREGDGYQRLLLGDGRAGLLADLQQQAEALRYNWPAFTSEVRWTDRVFRFHSSYLNHFVSPPLPAYRPNQLFNMLCGNIGNALYFPIAGVRWLTPPRDFAALVTQSNPAAFAAELFHFGKEARPMEVTFQLLRPGKYELSLLEAQSGTVFQRQVFTVGQKEKRLRLQLPSRQLCILEASRK